MSDLICILTVSHRRRGSVADLEWKVEAKIGFGRGYEPQGNDTF